MNRTKIEWVQNPDRTRGYTINPIVGCRNPYGCREECYARAQMKRQKHRCLLCYRFELHTHPERLASLVSRRKAATVFLGSCAEIYDRLVRQFLVDEIHPVMRGTAHILYLTLTKRPEDVPREIPDNCWVGVSWDGRYSTPDKVRFSKLIEKEIQIRSISCEPLLRDPVMWMSPEDSIDLEETWNHLDWLIIGGRTGRKPFQPPAEWIDTLLVWADQRNIPVFIKNNSGYPVKIQEFPEEYWKRPNGED